MLTAIVHGKARRIEVEELGRDLRWRDVFRRSEDLLTAAFFGRLSYLSDASILRVMAVLIGRSTAESLGLLKELEFWPSLKGLKGRVRVEPDVLIHFEHALIVVEVKPPFGGTQSVEQWQKELGALEREIDDGERDAPAAIHLLALGGNTAANTRRSQAVPCLDSQLVHQCEWDRLIAALHHFPRPDSRADATVFEHWMWAFELFGLRRPSPPWQTLQVYARPGGLSMSSLNDWPRMVPQPERQRPTSQTSAWSPLLAFVLNNLLTHPSI